MASSLLQLSKIISTSLENVSRNCDKAGITLPSSQDNAVSRLTDAHLLSGPFLEDITKIVNASQQLIELLTPADALLLRLAQGTCTSAAIRVALEAHIAEILRETPNGTLSAATLSALTHINENKLTRVLRVLSAVNVFREVEPGVFSNTRLSSALDTGKSVGELKESPLGAIHHGTTGTVAAIHTYVEEGAKSNSFLMETLRESGSNEPYDAAFTRAFTNHSSWRDSPYFVKTAAALRGFGSPIWTNEACFKFNELPQDAVVVGVGLCGRLICDIAERYPHLKYIVQDSAEMCQEWPKILARPADATDVEFQAHSMFEPQPVKNAAIFIVSLLNNLTPIHYLEKALAYLRVAATPETRLLMPIGVVSRDMATIPEGKVEYVEDVTGIHPVLSTAWEQLDIQLMTLTNGARYDYQELDSILTTVGWDINKVIITATGHSVLVAERQMP